MAGALSDLTRLQKVTTTLQTAFPMLANVIDGIKLSMEAGFGATNTLKIALSGLWDIIKAHPVIAAVTAIIALAAAIDNAKKSAAQAAEETARQIAEEVSANKQEIDSLDELVSKYKELAKADRSDVSNREEIAKIQNEITSLVGSQADNLDLVNGKLDEELQKINHIYKTQNENSTYSYRRALSSKIEEYSNADRSIKEDKGFFLNGLDNITSVTSEDLEITAWRNLLDKLNIDGLSIDYNDSLVLPDNMEQAAKDLREVIDAINEYETAVNNKDWKKVNEITGGGMNSTFDSAKAKGYFSDVLIEVEKVIGETESAAQDLIGNLLNSYYYSQGKQDLSEIENLDDYVKYRQKIIDDLSNDKDIKSAIEQGLISEDYIESTTDAFLAGLPEISKYYNDWYNKFGSDVAKSVIDLKEKLQADVYFFEPENLYKGKNNVIEDWFNNLTDGQKEIIVKIKGEYETDDWTFEEWQEAIKNYKPPESAKFHFSDLISTDDFKNKIDDYKDKLTELDESLEKLRDGSLSEEDKISLFKNFPELASQADNLDEAIVNLIGDTKSSVIEDFNEQLDYMQTDDDVAALNSLKDSLLNLADTEGEIASLSDKIEKLNSALDDLKSTYDDIQSVIDDYNDNGYLTLDNLQSIMDLEPEYINLLIDENGQINLNNQAYKDYVISKAKSLLVNQLSSLYESILAMTAEEAQAYANAKAFDEETRSVNDLLTATTKLYVAQAQAKDSANGNTNYMDALTKSFGTAANYAAIVESYINSLGTSQNEFTEETNGATSALEAQKEALEDEKDALEDYKDSLEDAKDALEDYKDSLEDAQDDIQSLIDLTIDYIKQMKENEKDAINEQIDALDKQKDALDDQKDAYSDLISKKKEEIELLYEEKEAQDELSEKQKSAAKDALALAIAQLDDSSAGKKAQKQAKDNYDSSQKDLKDYLDEQEKDKRISALEEEETAYEEMIEKRKAAIDEQVEHLESKIDEIDAYLDNSRKLYEDACNMIDNDNGTLYSNLWNYTYTYTTKTRAEFDYLWSSAQAAIQRYKGDNDTLIGTMEILQGKIYDTDRQIENLNGQIDDCETQISNLDSAISSTSNAINSTSGAIDNVSSSLGGLSSNIERYKKALDELTKANNNGGDIPSNAKWTFDYTDKNGDIRTAWSTSKDFETAVRDIQSIIEKETGYYRPDVFGGIKKRYASGTRNSSGGVSITQEDGFEAIFGKLSSGQYTMMPQGSQVFTAAQTDNLYGFASNPQKFISDVIGKMSSFLSSSYGNFADSARGVTNKVTKYGGDMTFSSAPVYHIYGKVDNDTLNKMDKQERQRYELFKKQFMLEMLREKNNL